jgi:parallel beta-helix repeat protein
MANLWTAIRIEGSYETLYTPSNNNITGNKMTKNSVGIYLTLTLNNSISGNVIENGSEGITLDHANRNSIMENNITNNDRGIWLQDSANNLIVNNNILRNGMGIHYHSSSGNVIYHNNLENNATQVDYNKPFNAGEDTDSTNSWDNGISSGGNCWGSFYSGTDSDGDGIGNTPYVINANNRDNYPLMNPFIIPEFSLLLILPLFMIATLLAVIVYKKKGVKTSQS